MCADNSTQTNAGTVNHPDKNEQGIKRQSLFEVLHLTTIQTLSWQFLSWTDEQFKLDQLKECNLKRSWIDERSLY